MIKRTVWAIALIGLSISWIEGSEFKTIPVHIPGKSSIEALPGQVVVRYKKGKTVSGQKFLAKDFQTQALRRIPALDSDIIPVPSGMSVTTFISQLNRRQDIEFAEPIVIYKKLAAAPNDTYFSMQDYLPPIRAIDNDGNTADAWDITQGSPNIIVAVIDTGVKTDHTDLDDNMWVNPNPTAFSGINGATMLIDGNGDGDCNDGGEVCASNDPSDDDGHGTRVAGIIAAETNNSNSITGIAPNCKIMAVKVLNFDGDGTSESAANGIIYAANNGADVINLSLGGPAPSALVAAAIDYAMSKNIVVVAAAGNDAPCNVLYPAAISRVIAVGATTVDDGLSNFTCTGSALDVMAPGVQLVSTSFSGFTSCLTPGLGCSGTSFSAPLVSGLAALIRSLRPTMSVDDVAKYINYFADDLGPSGFDKNFGFGRINAFATLTAVNTDTPILSNPGYSGETFAQPNPYDPTTGRPVTISLPASMGTNGIRITIFDLAGQKVKELTGTNLWDGRNEDGNMVSSGPYFYFAESSGGDIRGKITVVK